MKIEFTDREYWHSHMKAPKGRGHWAFEFNGQILWVAGTLSEAKRACKEEIRKIVPADYTGTVWVKILP